MDPQPFLKVQTTLSSNDHHQQYCGILGQLTLHKKEKDRVLEVQPVSSVLEDHICSTISLSDLQRMLEDRVYRQCVLHAVPQDDQQALTAVMMLQLRLICQGLKGVNHDPLLSQEEKQQLQSEVFSEILQVCERLYLRCIHQLDTLRRRGIFSDEANRSRLCAQMALDCTSLLNLQSIRDRVTAEIKAARKVKPSSDVHGQQGGSGTKLSSRMSDLGSQQEANIERDLQEINDAIGELNLECVYDLIPCHQKDPIHQRQCTADCSPNAAGLEEAVCGLRSSFTRIRGCRSMPDLQPRSALEELGMETLPAKAPTPEVQLDMDPSSHVEGCMNDAEDLRRLVQDDASVDGPEKSNLDADLTSLISILPQRCSTKCQLLQETLQKLTEEEEGATVKRAAMEKPQHQQPTAIEVSISPKSVVRTAGPRVSDRVFTGTVNLKMYPPIYSDLTEEIEPSSVKWLDQNLESGTEIKEVYRELSKTISTHYLNFDEMDPMIEPAVEDTRFKCVPLHKKNQRLFNSKLKRSNIIHPSNRKMEVVMDHKKPKNMTSRAQTTWLQRSKSNLCVDDYLKYISNQRLDYLGVVFHLYDSDEEGDEKKALTQHEEKTKRRSEKIDSLKVKEDESVTGVWSVNSVLLGEVDSPEEDTSAGTTQEDQERGSQPGQKPTGAADEGLEDNQAQLCLEKIWNALSFPHSQRQEMAIKYSSHSYRDRLKEAIAAWEHAVKLIQRREALLSQLEVFEREPSDPNRFFQPGFRGTSIARRDESKRRQKLNKEISALEKILSRDIQRIKYRFCDTVTYHGKPYEQKMRWDRTEMLYCSKKDAGRPSTSSWRGSSTAPQAASPPTHFNAELPHSPHPSGTHPLIQQ